MSFLSLDFKGKKPDVSEKATVLDGVRLIGDVRIAESASIWFNSVLRGDINHVSVGRMTNIQDLALCHVADDFCCEIGEYVTVGHSANIHACRVGDRVLIGMGATILDGAIIEPDSMVGAGALITPGMRIPSGSLAVGVPARVVRRLTDEERRGIVERAEKYASLASYYRG